MHQNKLKKTIILIFKFMSEIITFVASRLISRRSLRMLDSQRARRISFLIYNDGILVP